MKWLILALVLYLLYRMFTNDRQKKKETQKQEKDHLVATGELVKDPECGTYIDAESAITVRDGDRVHRFCSYDCRDKFLARMGKIPERSGDA